MCQVNTTGGGDSGQLALIRTSPSRMLRKQRDKSPLERELAPVTHGIHVVVCRRHQNSNGHEKGYITTKIDLIVVIKGTPGGREGQLEVGVDRSNCASQKSECVEIESHCELLGNNVSDFIR